MNNFNKIFLAVKQHCEETDSETDCIADVAQATGIEEELIINYFDALRIMGLIKYSLTKKSVSLTKQGMDLQSVFS